MTRTNLSGFVVITCDSSACMNRLRLGVGVLFPDDWIAHRDGTHHFCRPRCEARFEEEHDHATTEGSFDDSWMPRIPVTGNAHIDVNNGTMTGAAMREGTWLDRARNGTVKGVRMARMNAQKAFRR